MKDKNPEKDGRMERIKDLIRSMPGEKPDYDDLEQADPDRTEEAYQEEQGKWMEEIIRKKTADTFVMHSIGKVRRTDDRTWIEIKPRYRDAMSGLEGFSHIHVLFWFHENDTPENRSVLQVHPRKNNENPLTGVFATHSPLRPNLVGHTLCRILSVENTNIEIESIDARDQTPVVDIKCYIPCTHRKHEIRVPDWVKRGT